MINIFLTKKAKDLQEKAIDCAKIINNLALESLSSSERELLNKLLWTAIYNLETNLG